MNNLAILGPNKLLNKSLRRDARRLVRETINRNWFREAYKVSNRHYTVTNTNGQLVGFALINKNQRNQRGDVRIRLIGTNKGRGIGRVLMERIIDNARQRGFRPIGIGSNMRFNIQRSPSRPSPKRPASSSASSVRRSATPQKPHP